MCCPANPFNPFNGLWGGVSYSLIDFLVTLPLRYISTKGASILGSKSGWVCPPCLVPKNLLWDLSDVIYPLQTWDGTLRLIAESESCHTKAKASEVLLTQSIRNIPVCMCMEEQQISDFIPEYIPQPLQPLYCCLQHVLCRCSPPDWIGCLGPTCVENDQIRLSVTCRTSSFGWQVGLFILTLIIPFLNSSYLASRTSLLFLIYTTLQMGYQTYQALLQKNRALFSV